MAKISIKDLGAANIDVKPIHKDWSEGYAEQWEYYEATKCEKCGVIVTGSRGGEKHSDIDNDTECDGYVPETSGPMMNYYYPVRAYQFDPNEAAKKIAHLPLCVVEFLDNADEDSYALALTGGGMDLSWEICEAYICTGQLPPTHFSLPGMAGRGNSPRDRRIISACKESIRVSMLHLKSQLAGLKRFSVKDKATTA